MSTAATIRFCTENEEIGALVLHADGYPEFVRGQLLEALTDEAYHDGEEAMDAVPHILAGLYNWDVFETEKDLAKWERSFNLYQSSKQAREHFGSTSHEYTVHVVDGKVYF